MNITRLGPDIELERPLTRGEMQQRGNLLTIVPLGDIVAGPGAEDYSTLARWRQVAFHTDAAKLPGMAEQQRPLEVMQAERFLSKLGILEAA